MPAGLSHFFRRSTSPLRLGFWTVQHVFQHTEIHIRDYFTADLAQNEELLAKIKKLEKDNARLQRKATTMASVQDDYDGGNNDDDPDKLPVESEEEQDYITEARKKASTFRSRGIFDADGKDSSRKSKTLRRMDDPAARPSLSGESSILSTTSSATIHDSCSGSESPSLSEQSMSLPHRQGPCHRSSILTVAAHNQSSRQVSESPPPQQRSVPAATIPPPFRGVVVPTGEAKASDYEPHATKLILVACRHFEALVLNENPFPEDTEQDTWAKDAWKDACTALKLSYTLPEHVKKMIMSRTSHARGALKDCIRPMVATKYGFSSHTDEPMKAANCALYERLLDLNNPEGPEPIFHYQDVDALAGYAQNEIFRNTDGIGLQLPAQFCPIREAMLAIIFTASHSHRASDGALKSEGGRFSEKEYKPKYLAHLAHIELWTKLDPVVTEAMCKQMHDDVCRASGAAPVVGVAPMLLATSRSCLQAELEEFAKRMG
ncbi:hypothetical protein V8D89_009022 [Ganoderma adspersum]